MHRRERLEKMHYLRKISIELGKLHTWRKIGGGDTKRCPGAANLRDPGLTTPTPPRFYSGNYRPDAAFRQGWPCPVATTGTGQTVNPDTENLAGRPPDTGYCFAKLLSVAGNRRSILPVLSDVIDAHQDGQH